MIQVRKSHERGHAHHGWLESYHTFSFADYHDPAYTHFGPLRVINEDRVAPKMGFGLHAHRNMEIITYVVDGALRHRDSLGNTAVMRSGDVQRISAGAGIEHSEFNDSASAPVHFLQIWIIPDVKQAAPRYEEKSFAKIEPGHLRLITSKTGRDGSIPIHQDADLYVAKLNPGGSLQPTFLAGRSGWLQVIAGDLKANGHRLVTGDAASFSETDLLTISATQPSHFLLFDLH